MNLLVVENDPDYVILIRETLRFSGHEVLVESTVEGAQRAVAEEAPDVVLVAADVQGRSGSGLDLCRALRTASAQLPLILLGGGARNMDVVTGFRAGADDYVVKPFHPGELAARVDALIRRAGLSSKQASPPLSLGGLVLDHHARTVAFAGHPVECTPIEYALLYELLSAPDEVVAHQHLNQRIWDYQDLRDASLLRGHVSSLRRKLREAGCPDGVIRSVHGVGYAVTLDDAVAARYPAPVSA